MSPIISGAGGGGLGAVTLSGAAAASQVPVASSSSAAAWGYPPGFEISYTQITSTANITDTSEATATALISPGAIVFDGTAVYVEFFTYALQSPTNGSAIVTLFEGATQITRLAISSVSAAGTQIAPPCFARYKFTPTAASHTYKVCGFVPFTTGTPGIFAGSGGTNGVPPAYVRFVKA